MPSVFLDPANPTLATKIHKHIEMIDFRHGESQQSIQNELID
jgi:hypothetical protein